MTTKSDLEGQVEELNREAAELHSFLMNRPCAADREAAEIERAEQFLARLSAIEETTAIIRALAIRHSRALGRGLRHNGERDRRFRANRPKSPADLRYSR